MNLSESGFLSLKRHDITFVLVHSIAVSTATTTATTTTTEATTSTSTATKRRLLIRRKI